MKIQTKYICDVCGWKYDTEKECEECEAQKKVDPLSVGTIMRLSSFYPDTMVFGIMKVVKDGHHWNYLLAGARDTKMGDNFDDGQYCGCSSRDTQRPPIKGIPCYERLVAHIKSKGITPKDFVAN
jgi:hypothetical protein